VALPFIRGFLPSDLNFLYRFGQKCNIRNKNILMSLAEETPKETETKTKLGRYERATEMSVLTLINRSLQHRNFRAKHPYQIVVA